MTTLWDRTSKFISLFFPQVPGLNQIITEQEVFIHLKVILFYLAYVTSSLYQ